jgi:hypothetical protein
MPVALNTTAKIVDVMRFSEEPCIRQVLSVYDNCPAGDRENLPFEAFVVKAGAKINELIGSIIMTYRAVQTQKSAMMVMARHPDVLNKTIDYAMLPAGHQDRRLIHESTNFAPTSKGSTFNFNLPIHTGPPVIEEKRESIDVESVADVNEVFPVITTKQQGWQESKNLLLKDRN